MITFDCFLSELNRLATGYHANHYCDSYEKLSADEKAEIKERYETLNQFECIDKFQLKAQRDDYDTTYMGEGVKAGDMLWFDGEHFCNRDTVEVLEKRKQHALERKQEIQKQLQDIETYLAAIDSHQQGLTS